ncbi:hypothetical protein B0T26DRAFT_677285 [Lasiosphaeria miniovina]|uniref:Uncharacterized protein n=1 Tax=Lasiosphaeria miniovina TaxID=1954250 RepID=A0AA40ABN0_9PEZI|nr:uncharacterized protein B0T26DRAFT_677285 [Lasiosphaeria miniovina]KAK0712877.1 hypothetical protein B0T26DRAFT_677285 [Lasiosphaeria miniovina]
MAAQRLLKLGIHKRHSRITAVRLDAALATIKLREVGPGPGSRTTAPTPRTRGETVKHNSCELPTEKLQQKFGNQECYSPDQLQVKWAHKRPDSGEDCLNDRARIFHRYSSPSSFFLVCISIALEAGRLWEIVAMLPTLEQEYELRKCNRRIPLQDCYLQIQQEAAGLLASMTMQFNNQSGTSTSKPSALMCREFSVDESEYAPQRRNHFETFQRLWNEEQADLAAYARRHQESTLERPTVTSPEHRQSQPQQSREPNAGARTHTTEPSSSRYREPSASESQIRGFAAWETLGKGPQSPTGSRELPRLRGHGLPLENADSNQEVIWGLLETMRERLDEGDGDSLAVLYRLILELLDRMNAQAVGLTDGLNELRLRQDEAARVVRVAAHVPLEQQKGKLRDVLLHSIEREEEENDNDANEVDQGDDDDDDDDNVLSRLKVEFDKSIDGPEESHIKAGIKGKGGPRYTQTRFTVESSVVNARQAVAAQVVTPQVVVPQVVKSKQGAASTVAENTTAAGDKRRADGELGGSPGKKPAPPWVRVNAFRTLVSYAWFDAPYAVIVFCSSRLNGTKGHDEN